MSHFLCEEEDDDAMDGGLGVSGMKRGNMMNNVI